MAVRVNGPAAHRSVPEPERQELHAPAEVQDVQFLSADVQHRGHVFVDLIGKGGALGTGLNDCYRSASNSFQIKAGKAIGYWLSSLQLNCWLRFKLSTARKAMQ